MYDYLLSGSLCGSLYWTLSYPSDVLKTKIQLSNNSYLHEFQRCITERTLYRGFSVVLLRCIPVNGINFFIY